MPIKNNETVPVVDPWTDALGVISIIEDSVIRLESKFTKSCGNFDSLADYAISAICLRGLSSLTFLGEDTFFDLSKSKHHDEIFTPENADFALQGYKIALRACLQVVKNRRRRNENLIRFFPELMQARLTEIQTNDDYDISASELLYGGINDFVYSFMPEPPENKEIIQKDAEGLSFSNRWAYKLGYLQPVNVAFGLMIDPETYFNFIDKPEKWDGVVDPDSINDLLDISSLPMIEED